MKIINLTQSSSEWLEWRRSKITATSAGILMLNNPWKTPLDLFEEMLGMVPPVEKNEAMERGNRLEPIARMLFEEMIGMEFAPICCEHDTLPWFAASLDGWNEDNQVVLEIKCPGERTHREALEGIIPKYYQDQIFHQLGCSGGVSAYYVSYRPEHERNIAVVEVKRDQAYIDHIIETERKFYFDNLCDFKEPVEWKMKINT